MASSKNRLEVVEDAMKCFEISNSDLSRISEMILQEFVKGLTPETRETSTLKMLPTFVRDVPDGSESGKFMAIDLGGTNFRVLVANVDGEHLVVESECYRVPDAVKVGCGENLFDLMAQCVVDFAQRNGLTDKLNLGFTFSFPYEQTSLGGGKLIEWTKGFSCPDVVGQDVVQQLRQALRKRGGVKVDSIAILNDTTAALISCAHSNHDCRVGLIVGTGTNACYMEHIDNVKTWTGDQEEPRQVIINTEIGAFGNDGCLEFIRTTFDKELDNESANPKKQIFEKMTSGKYIGEITRKIILKLANDGLMLNGEPTECLKKRSMFSSKCMSEVEIDAEKVYANTMRVFQQIGVKNASEEDCEILKLVCSKVSDRAACMISAALAAILNKLERPHTVIAVDGSVYRHQPHFKRIMEEKTAELTRPEFEFKLVLSEDGSGRGAALVSAVAARIERDLNKQNENTPSA